MNPSAHRNDSTSSDDDEESGDEKTDTSQSRSKSTRTLNFIDGLMKLRERLKEERLVSLSRTKTPDPQEPPCDGAVSLYMVFNRKTTQICGFFCRDKLPEFKREGDMWSSVIKDMWIFPNQVGVWLWTNRLDKGFEGIYSSWMPTISTPNPELTTISHDIWYWPLNVLDTKKMAEYYG